VSIAAALLGLLAAALFAVASVAQQKAAADVPDDKAMGLRLIGQLVRRPLWWAGSLGDAGGFLAQGAALGLGSLLLVQPLLVTALLFALPLGAAWAGRRLSRSDWLWAAVLSLSLAVFVVVADPTAGIDRAPGRDWLGVAAALTPVLALCLLGAATRRRSRAMLLAVATGIFYGVTAALTKSVVAHLGDGIVPLLSSWETYALAAVATLGTVCQQSAFQAGDLGVSMPAVTVLEPVVAVGIGVSILQEDLRTSGLGWVVVALSTAGLAAGTVMLAGSAARVGSNVPGRR
jgi:drug/metabolite transporter (DMT)-like permease